MTNETTTADFGAEHRELWPDGKPDWVLESELFPEWDEEDAVDLAAFKRPTERAEPRRILPRVVTKFNAFVERRNLEGGTIEEYLGRSTSIQLTPVIRWAMSVILGAKHYQDVEVRMCWGASNCSLHFFICDNIVIEVAGFRALRTLKRRAEHLSKVIPYGTPPAEVFKRISAMKYRKEIQGGLLKQEKSPRVTWKVRPK